MNWQSVEILLVEDNPGDIRLAKEALKEAKIANNLHCVIEGVEALEFLNKEGQYAEAARPDLIILDLNLPKVSGHEVLEVIKERESLRRIPVVVLTSSEAEEDILKSYDLHANCYIRKPIGIESFIEVVTRIETFWFHVVKLPPA